MSRAEFASMGLTSTIAKNHWNEQMAACARLQEKYKAAKGKDKAAICRKINEVTVAAQKRCQEIEKGARAAKTARAQAKKKSAASTRKKG